MWQKIVIIISMDQWGVVTGRHTIYLKNRFIVILMHNLSLIIFIICHN